MSLTIDGLSFAYGTQTVLNRLAAGPLERGALTALVGPNGSGKSTLFRCFSGAAKPQGGRILLETQDLACLKDRERGRRVFHLAQDLSARAALTVFEVVLLARKSLSGGVDLRAGLCDLRLVQTVLESLDLEALSQRHIGTLSGGQRQLVGIAQALVREPDVLLLDEPTSALDVRRQLEVLQIVQRVTRERSMITIVALHDLSLAARFAERLLVLKDGQIAEEGQPEDVLQKRATSDAYRVGIHLERSARGSLLVEPYLSSLRAAE
ncbi:ABC transporter ATP-binding protein [Microvirga rosea]|uniref:ABC transporter ATP-binding protein n=1 Tax=Microvirga rosea TaxID=2715425 RepID=UPI001D0B4FB6|nr:ABC transporter ATP-binding protein [Microvirga rosea]MCB8821406.1 ABC transporter ATP-binding protein [Microvirga rosea]